MFRLPQLKDRVGNNTLRSSCMLPGLRASAELIWHFARKPPHRHGHRPEVLRVRRERNPKRKPAIEAHGPVGPPPPMMTIRISRLRVAAITSLLDVTRCERSWSPPYPRIARSDRMERADYERIAKWSYLSMTALGKAARSGEVTLQSPKIPARSRPLTVLEKARAIRLGGFS